MKFWIKIIKESNSFGILFFLSLVIICAGLLSPIFIIHIFNRYITFGLEGTLIFLVSGAIFVATIEYLFRNLRHDFCSKIISKPVKELKFSIIKTFYESNVDYIRNNNNNTLNEVIDVNNNIYKTLDPNNQSNILDLLFGVLIICILFFLNYILGTIFFLISIFVFIIQVRFHKSKLNHLQEISQNLNSEKNFFKDVNDKSDFLKSYNKFQYIGFMYSDNINKIFKNDDFLAKKNSDQINLNYFLIVLTSIIIIGTGSTFVVNGDLTIGNLIGFNIFSARALQILINGQKSYFSFKVIDKYFLNINNFFKNIVNKNGLKLNLLNGNIDLKNLDYSYDDKGSFLFRNLSMDFNRGQISNISGSNGIGKTTLCKIILGLIKPNSGELYVDKTGLDKLSFTWWRDQLGYVPQNLNCLNTSIIDNIKIGNPKLNEEEIGRLIQSIGLGGIIKQSNLSFNAPLDYKISKGVHKKIHYARMIASNRPIIILDDPLESLDRDGKNFVLNLIQSLKKANKTVICFSNDLEIINLSDKKYRLDD